MFLLDAAQRNTRKVSNFTKYMLSWRENQLAITKLPNSHGKPKNVKTLNG